MNLARELGMELEEGMSQRILGQALLANEQPKPALSALERSLSLLADQDPYEAARTKIQWGQVLVSGLEVPCSSSGQGTAMLQEAREAFEKLGAKRDLATVNGLLGT